MNMFLLDLPKVGGMPYFGIIGPFKSIGIQTFSALKLKIKA
jgi:hypothetical protein